MVVRFSLKDKVMSLKHRPAANPFIKDKRLAKCITHLSLAMSRVDLELLQLKEVIDNILKYLLKRKSEGMDSLHLNNITGLVVNMTEVHLTVRMTTYLI